MNSNCYYVQIKQLEIFGFGLLFGFVPLGMRERSELVASLVNAKLLYAVETTGLTPVQRRGLRAAVVTALWGTQRKRRCAETILTLFVRGHAVDGHPHLGLPVGHVDLYQLEHLQSLLL